MTDFSQNDQKLAKKTSFGMFEVYSFQIHEVKTITYNFYIQNVPWFSFLGRYTSIYKLVSVGFWSFCENEHEKMKIY